MRRVHGCLQHYAWGDRRAIPELLGLEPDGTPVAELWFGTHPVAPASVEGGAPLEQLTGTLPYLLKVLAAAAPLSLQVHPTLEQAADGFGREQAAGTPLSSPSRNYRDDRHKPELLCALTPFDALCGVAPAEGTDRLLASLGSEGSSMRTTLGHGGVDGVIGMLLHDRPDIRPLARAAAAIDDPRARWFVRIAEIHPDDPSAAIALLLNHVTLQPGEAIYLGAGNLHAYLRGVGVEVMAASDNVLRAGLTDKHVDVEEVLRILDDSPLDDPVVRPVPVAQGGAQYPVPVDDFRITRYDVSGEASWHADGPELVLCTSGAVGDLRRGECGVALDGEHVHLSGTGTAFRVGSRRR